MWNSWSTDHLMNYLGLWSLDITVIMIKLKITSSTFILDFALVSMNFMPYSVANWSVRKKWLCIFIDHKMQCWFNLIKLVKNKAVKQAFCGSWTTVHAGDHPNTLNAGFFVWLASFLPHPSSVLMQHEWFLEKSVFQGAKRNASLKPFNFIQVRRGKQAM